MIRRFTSASRHLSVLCVYLYKKLYVMLYLFRCDSGKSLNLGSYSANSFRMKIHSMGVNFVVTMGSVMCFKLTQNSFLMSDLVEMSSFWSDQWVPSLTGVALPSTVA